MKNQRGLSDLATTIIMVVVAIACVLVVWYLVSNVVKQQNQPNFTITKQECHNETSDVYYTFDEVFEKFECGVKKVACYDKNNNLIINATCIDQRPRECFKSKIEKFSNYTVEMQYNPSNYGFEKIGTIMLNNEVIDVETYFSQNYDWMKKGTINHTICEDKEVDEINVSIFTCIYNSEEETNCNENFSADYIYNKKEITDIFLNDFCECIICVDKKINLEWLNEGCKKNNWDECLRYKCGDNYQVEVTK